MTAIFTHQDCDGDGAEILADSDDPQEDLALLTSSRTGDSAVGVRLDRDAVRRLVTALIAWETGGTAPEPVYPADSMYGQLIRKAVAEEVARVLPLHQAPMAQDLRCKVCQAALTDEDVADVCSDRCAATASRIGTYDPEPHDVGHPVYEDARPLFAPGTKEYYEKVLGRSDAEDARPHPVNTDPAPGFLGATLPVGPVRCGGCGHGWNDHTVGVCWGAGGACGCHREQLAPVPVTESDKVWGEQGAPPVECTCTHEFVRPHGRLGCDWSSCTCRWTGAS